jgi:acetylornithine deacetylase/succinyl-diaminopimelate desuccinylase-like protein
VGELEGSERPDEVVVVGAHLDSWDVGQGAHDDGAGCCQAIEAVRLLAKLGLRPRRTIRVVLFMNEENGLRGGRAYAKAHAAELPKHVMALESDRGGFTPRGFSTNANPGALAILRRIAGHLKDAGAGEVVEGSGGADISPMGKAGVVLVGYLCDLQRYFDLHHSAEDTIDKVNERELELGTAAIASLVYAVADLPERLPPNEVESDRE